MTLSEQVDWTYRLERKAVTAFARTFRAKLGKFNTLKDIGPALARSKHWVSFHPNETVHVAIHSIVAHLTETYGLEVIMSGGALHNEGSERSWQLPESTTQADRAMRLLRNAEPMLEPRPYVTNGETDSLSWAIFSSSDWAELEAADLYATRALFPLKGKIPVAPEKPLGVAQRQREAAHVELLSWVQEHQAAMVAPLTEALCKLESSHVGTTEERDALSQIYRIERRARR